MKFAFLPTCIGLLLPLSATAEDKAATPPSGETKLFDGKSLAGWKASGFLKQGKVEVADGAIVAHAGEPMSGVTFQDAKKLPKIDYEISLEAKKIDGRDFFCALTFPVNDKNCSLVLGGWGGETCGLSSLNGADAAQNETTTYRPFEKNRWYKVKVRVAAKKITAWIDGEQILDADIDGVEVGVRVEVIHSCPLGIASYRTKAAWRDIVVKAIALKP